LPPKKFGWTGYHSKIAKRKKRIVDEYIGISPSVESGIIPNTPYTPDQYYALRRIELQMSRMALNIKKKRGTPSNL
jgi:hypothetical protein